MTGNTVRLLGFVPLAGLASLSTALNAVEGEPVHAVHGPGVAALLQPEPASGLFNTDRTGLKMGLLSVQRRLEVACAAGPVLPMDPSSATCATAMLADLLDQAWEGIGAALIAHGDKHQWDVILRWAPEPVLHRNRTALAKAGGTADLADAVRSTLLTERNRREAALLNHLAPAVRAFAAGGAACAETEIAVTVMVDAGTEAKIEAALGGLSWDDTTIDLRGPLPPLSFAAARFAAVEAGDIASAWQVLDLPEWANLSGLHRQWRLRSASVHPDQLAGSESQLTVPDITAAYQRLRPLLLQDPNSFHSLEGVLRHAGQRLIVPETAPWTTASVLELAS